MRRCIVTGTVCALVLSWGVGSAKDEAPPVKVQAFLDGLTGTWNTDGTFRGQVEYRWDSRKRAIIGVGQWTQVEGGTFNSWTDVLCWDGASSDGVTNLWLSATDHTVARGEVQGRVLSKTVMVGKETVVGSPVASSTNLRIEHKGPDKFVMTVRNVIHEGEERPDMTIVYTRAKSAEGGGDNGQEERNRALVRRLMVEIPAADWKAQEKLHSPDFVWHGPDGVTTMTREELCQDIRKLSVAFPDFRRTIEDMVVEGNTVVVRLSFRGTHRGEYAGIEPTGKKLVSHGMVLLRIADGKVAEAWEQYDELSFREQLMAPSKRAKGLKPAAVKRMLKRLAGNWAWTGQQANIGAESSPYGQAGRFVGNGEGRLIMDGQFILDEYQEKSPEGHVLHGVSLLNYDPIKKCFVARDCLSDGSVSVSEFTFDGRVRRDQITITSKTGEILLARVVGEYSRDWKRYEATWEGSTDNGQTWQEWATLVNEKSGETPDEAGVDM